MLRHNDPFQSIPSPKNQSNPYMNWVRTRKYSKNEIVVELPILYGELLKNRKGNWNKEHPDNSLPPKVILEIGCHFGDTLSNMASNHPEDLFLGMDITYKRLVKSSLRVVRDGNTNAKLLYANALTIEHLFKENELDGVLVFFPDPWQKRGQNKHRLLTATFLNSLLSRVKDDGFFWFKSDHQGYFDDVKASLEAVNGRLDFEGIPSFFQKDYSSSFARLFEKQGLKTRHLVWTPSR